MSIIRFLKPTQAELFLMLKHRFKDAIAKDGNYILVKGESPVMLVAHLDTVHKNPVKTICQSSDGNILMSPEGIGGDDRCGVYAVCSIYKETIKKPWLLFTCDEEIGCIGADYFADDFIAKNLPSELSNLKMIIEIDRKGKNDAVYYDCDNPKFEDYITSKGFVTNYGSVSDISVIAPTIGVAAVNLSSGYYNAHTKYEYIKLSDLKRTIEKVKEIVIEADSDAMPQFIYEGMYDDYYWIYGREKYKGVDIYTLLNEDEKYMYNELLEIYNQEELNAFINYYGIEVISDLYEDEIYFANELKTEAQEEVRHGN